MSSHKFVVQTSFHIEEVEDDDEETIISSTRARRRSSGDHQYTDIKSKYFARLNLQAPKAGKATPASFSRVSQIVYADPSNNQDSSPVDLQSSSSAEVIQNFPRIASHSPSIAIPIKQLGSKSASNSREPTPPHLTSDSNRQSNSMPTDNILSPPRLRKPWVDEDATGATMAHTNNRHDAAGFFHDESDSVDRVLAAIVRGDDVPFSPSPPHSRHVSSNPHNINMNRASSSGRPLTVAKSTMNNRNLEYAQNPLSPEFSIDDPFESDIGGDYFEEEVPIEQHQPRFSDYFRS